MNTFVDKPEWVDTIVSEQETKVSVDGKYKQYLRDEITKDSEVHEYDGPDGTGYVLFQFETRKDGEYMRTMGEGGEAYRYFDWRKVDTA